MPYTCLFYLTKPNQTHSKGGSYAIIEWEVNEDGYEEQIIIPKKQRDLAAEEGIGTENKQKVAVRILNLNTGETYTGRLAITGNHQVYLPTEIQKMLEGAGRIRIQLL